MTSEQTTSVPIPSQYLALKASGLDLKGATSTSLDLRRQFVLSPCKRFLKSPMITEYLRRFSGTKIQIQGPQFAAPAPLVEPVLFVDGGTHFRTNATFGLSIGDGDSSEGDLDILLDTKKDFSDLSYALDQLPESFTEIHLYGFSGGRKDHELFNIFEIHQLLQKRAHGTQVWLDNWMLGLSRGHWKLTGSGSFSLFQLSQSNRLHLSGHVDYRVKEGHALRPLSSHGLSNRAHGPFEIDSSHAVFLIFQGRGVEVLSCWPSNDE